MSAEFADLLLFCCQGVKIGFPHVVESVSGGIVFPGNFTFIFLSQDAITVDYDFIPDQVVDHPFTPGRCFLQ